MSTRCNIVVLEADGSRYPCMIYKHCDGYPDGEHGVMAWLAPLVERFRHERGDDAEYCVAQILRHQAVKEFQTDGRLLGFTGWGVCTDLHGDIAYYYEVTPATGRVVCRRPGGAVVKTSVPDGWDVVEPGPEQGVPHA